MTLETYKAKHDIYAYAELGVLGFSKQNNNKQNNIIHQIMATQSQNMIICLSNKHGVANV